MDILYNAQVYTHSQFIASAMEGYILRPAYAAAGAEDRSGKLAPEYLPDLILLEQDPFVTCQLTCWK